ncbi:MAG: thiamine pyrophosphate-requiring protein [Alphaproteobacteria bacterium]|nr:thiamine pyrophosphate-requiring protein [Alphaproteobacteria bacterium]
MTTTTTPAATVADAYLALLADRGIDYFFANAGTDFAPIIEAFSKARLSGVRVPKPVTVPHENVAVHLALGHAAVSGRPQAVMVHVSVGTANAVCGLINAWRANIPIFFTAGRTPLTEAGLTGSRDTHIHWPQEMFDQAGMVREAVKWDYELRHAVQLESVVDRALAIANSAPRGPIYLTLPREVLASPLEGFALKPTHRHEGAVPAVADPGSVAEAARLLARAERPMIATSRYGRRPADVAVLAALADRYALPVVSFVSRFVALPASHPMNLGGNPKTFVEAADVILVLDSDVPWLPHAVRPRADAKVIQIADDAVFSDYPIRGFASDLTLAGDPPATLALLDQALAIEMRDAADRIAARRARMAREKAAIEASRRAFIERNRGQTPIHPAWLCHCLNEAKGDEAIVIKESPTGGAFLSFERPGTMLNIGAAGGLGWGLGSAVGAKLAAPDRLVIAYEGDGSYMFGVPVAAHYVALDQDAPFLTVIANNQRWQAVRDATETVYPSGHAVRSNAEPLTYFNPALQLEKAVETAGGHGETATDPAALPTQIRRCIDIVTRERRQAVLNVITSA